MYTRSSESEVNEIEKAGDKDDLKLEDEISRFNVRELRNRNPKFGRFNRPNLFYPIYVAPVPDADGFCPVSLTADAPFSVRVVPLNSQNQESCWRWGKEKVLKNAQPNTQISNLVARKKPDGDYNVYEKYRKTTYKAKSIWDETEMINERGTVELGQLDLAGLFDFPKPVSLIKKAILLGTDEDSIVLDFFAGSATTAQAVLEINAEDGGSRSFILTQIPVPIDSTAVSTIAETAKKRIKRVIKDQVVRVQANSPKVASGFRVYHLGSSNLKVWKDAAETNGESLQQRFDLFETPLVEGWTVPNLLIELLLIEKYPLDSTIERRTEFTRNDVRMVGCEWFEKRLWVCLDKRVADETIQALDLSGEDVFVCLDSALTDEAKVRLADQGNVKTI